ncbi:MAG: SpoIIE family protein phosphatase [Planctomycetaceae bacterium]|nr:SpoIIE family protein phosphatase [Planctomycetaceae bacterium]
MAFLTSDTNEGSSKRFPLDKEVMTLGRHPDCHIVIEDSSVSRFHSQITFDGDGFYLEDLDSRNGTYLNDARLHQAVPLRDGDRIRICDLSLVFRNPNHNQDTDPRNSVRPVRRDSVAGVADATMIGNNMVVWDESPGEDEGSTIMSHMDLGSALDSRRQTKVDPSLKLDALMEITRALSGAISLDKVGPRVLDCLLKLFANADRGFIVLRENSTFRVISAKNRAGVSERQMRCSRTVFEHVMQTKQAIMSADTATDSRFDSSASIVDIEIRSMMCVPLLNSDGSAIGMLQLDSVRKSVAFREEDLELMLVVGMQAANALEKVHLLQSELTRQQQEHDLKVANEVQRAILPQRRPDLTGFSFYDYYRSANLVGGDYYDYIQLPDGRQAIIVADVAGHGVASAMLMAKFSTEVRYSLLANPELSDVGRQLNHAIYNWHLGRFITMILCILDPRTGKVWLINAGHPVATITRRGGQVTLQDVSYNGFAIGMVDEAKYRVLEFDLAVGDALVMYTDGLSEQVNSAGEIYGSPRVLREIKKYADKGVEAIGKGVIADLKIFSEKVPQADDLCLVCFGRIS